MVFCYGAGADQGRYVFLPISPPTVCFPLAYPAPSTVPAARTGIQSPLTTPASEYDDTYLF